MSFRRVVINAMFRYFRNSILCVHVDGRMNRTACTPHTIHLCRTLLHHS